MRTRGKPATRRPPRSRRARRSRRLREYGASWRTLSFPRSFLLVSQRYGGLFLRREQRYGSPTRGTIPTFTEVPYVVLRTGCAIGKGEQVLAPPRGEGPAGARPAP